ncbi:hypothetical protein [Tropicibacter sp. Alg240-R139]|uniref:hypothetical protein n=1 Tax=Tropicibacter sp. Alg240-R139 TaxID=2305991 RepID=UPI0013DFE34D|nr:hypothetical protein [Tropicibacter sp. Alg240-R139]
MKQKKIIFYELNEVPYRIFDHFAKLMPGSSLGILQNRARRYETHAEDSGHLSPWITWPTLHRGVSNDDHEISDFGMDLQHVDKEFPPLWQILSKAGAKVGLFGSLHSYPLPDNVSDYAFYVPDTFAAGPECFPKKFEAFQNFNLIMAGMNGSQVTNSIALKEAGQFLLAAPGLGLRGKTVGKLAGQLLAERRTPARSVRRRTSQTQISFDFFYKALRQNKPDVSFFFTNHVASSMHRYWPALFPQDYDTLNFEQPWLDTWAGEIPFVMQEAEEQLSLLLRFVAANPDYLLAVTTSMGQAAVEGRNRVERIVTIDNLRNLMRGLGVPDEDWEKRPAMVPQFVVAVSEAPRQRFLQNIGGLSINGRSIQIDDLGENVIRMEFSIANEHLEQVTYKGETADPKTFGLTCMELLDAAGANAYHVPDGMLMVYDHLSPEAQRMNPMKISTREIAPAVLQNFGVTPPGYMEQAFTL